MCIYIYVHDGIFAMFMYLHIFLKHAVQPLLSGRLLQPFNLLSYLLTAFDQNPAN